MRRCTEPQSHRAEGTEPFTFRLRLLGFATVRFINELGWTGGPASGFSVSVLLVGQCRRPCLFSVSGRISICKGLRPSRGPALKGMEPLHPRSVLAVRDVEASARHFIDVLGFRLDDIDPVIVKKIYIGGKGHAIRSRAGKASR